MSKYQAWWDSLSPQMQEYLKKQPVWHDSDLYRSFFLGTILGMVIGLCL